MEVGYAELCLRLEMIGKEGNGAERGEGYDCIAALERRGQADLVRRLKE